MSLDGAKLICLEKNGGHGEAIPAHGRTFKFGYYMNCDVVLEHPNAMGIQCVIDCDAFGRVTIENRCPELPITLNGKILKKLRPLLHNTEICILEKKFLWHYQSRLQSLAGLQSEDFSTPFKQIKKAQQPPNSEPGRRWRRQMQKRLTVHSFTYCIKSDQSLQVVEGTTDENKPPNRIKRKTASFVAEQMSVKKPIPTSPIAIDLIDLKTPKIRKKSLTGQRTPLSCCRLSETVITSYSPRQTGLRPEKSFAVVQSSPATPTKPQKLSKVSLGPFQQMLSPPVHNYRPSMHLIDLTTPTKRLITASNSRNLLKSALKKNHQKENQTPQQVNTSANTSMTSTGSSVCSVHTTDDESVIELSDGVSCSPSPILKTPVRVNTSKSLMKHAILSSAKKVAINKRLQHPTAPQTPFTPKNQQISNGVRFRSQSTPHRKSLGRVQSPGDNVRGSISMTGRAGNSMVTSTPFRADESTTSGMNTSERTSILHSPFSSLTSAKNKSRNSLMLKQALTRSPRTNSAQKRKSVSFLEAKQTPSKSQVKARKSVSFLDRIENEQSEESKPPHHTFSIEEDQASVKENVEIIATPRKSLTFTPEKEKDLDEGDKIDEEKTDPQTDTQVETLSSEKSARKSLIVSMKSSTIKSPAKADKSLKSNTPETPTTRKNIKRQSIFKPLPGVNSSSKEVKTYVSPTKNKSVAEQLALPLESSVSQNEDEFLKESVEEQKTIALRTLSELNKTTPLIKEKSNIRESILSQTPQSSRRRSKVTKATMSVPKIKRKTNIIEDDDFEGLDAVFKTPQARNLMILGSPQSISLQKPSTDSVALMHSTEFDFSANLDEIFKTPQSEFMTQNAVFPAEVEKMLSPEEAFDMLVGRPINTKTYERKSPKGGEISPLKGPKRSSLPKTDIEEWIDKVNESVEIVEEELDKHMDIEAIAEAVEIQDGLDQEEDEMSYFTSTEGEFSRDPLTMSSVSGSLNSTTRKICMRSPKDESVMTMQEHDEENIDASVLKDPLDVSAPFVKKISLSPNISGIDILDHTSESVFSETLEVSGESDKEQVTSLGDPDQTKTCVEKSMLVVQISPDKARIDMEKAFENFENERKLVDGERLILTPQPIKSVSKSNTRRTMGNQRTLDSYFDVKAPKKQRETKSDFENFKERPGKGLDERLVKTPQHEKPLRRDMRKIMDGQTERSFDLNLAKAESEMELASKNFKENPTIFKLEVVQTPDSKKVGSEDHIDMGTSLVQASKLDLKAAKAEREMELSFENLEDEPSIHEKRVVQTPDAKKIARKDYRKTMGTNMVPISEFDLQAAKAESEMELAFENFVEEPFIQAKRAVQTPDCKKITRKDLRRTMGTSFVPESKIDFQAAKAEKEMKLAFENFEEEPSIYEKRVAQTPDAKKITRKDYRRTMGTSLVPTSVCDLQAAKAEREMELAFENFAEEPLIQEKRVVQTPDSKKITRKDHRRTMGTSLVPSSNFDLQAAKAEREMELAFENFEEEPSIHEKRVAQTPDAKKITRKDYRRTMGTSFVPTSECDLQAAKAEMEMELAFENFTEEPLIQEKRVVRTPEFKKITRKDHRRTMGTSLVPSSKLDLQAAKAEREMELAFENFEEEPSIHEKRVIQTPDGKKIERKDYRRTMGTNMVPTSEFDLQAAKAEREMELAFENFAEVPSIQEKRAVQTPDCKIITRKDQRRTMGTSFVPESKLDLQAAKAEREMELAFENFEEEPSIHEKRIVQTPDGKKIARKDYRRTMGTDMVPTSEFDLQAAKAEREMELAFENFADEPSIQGKRAVQTPDCKKVTRKDHRRTMGTSLIPASKLDLQAAKAEREMEIAFKNFAEVPSIKEKRVIQTPDSKKITRKDHRRTMGTSFVPESKLDLQAAKAEREMELAFENFEEEPSIQEKRIVQTPDSKKISRKDHRRTMGTSLVPASKLDLQAAKAEREMELAFENFEEEPSFQGKRVVQTPDVKKNALKEHRRTMGTSLVPIFKLDVQAAKAEREMELAFENFEEQPPIQVNRVIQTPDAKKIAGKDFRRTMGTNLVPASKLDLQAAKAEREMELAFENFEVNPTIQEKRVVQTPELRKITRKDHRRTVGTSLVPESKLDIKAAKAELEMEIAFKDFKLDRAGKVERLVNTPDVKKRDKPTRISLGYKKVIDHSIDPFAVKSDHEREEKKKVVISKKVAIVKPLPKEDGEDSESEHELVTDNEEENQQEISQPVDGNVEHQICNKVVFKPNPPNKQLTPSSATATNSRPRRRRHHSVDDQRLVQKWDEGAHGKISFGEPVSSTKSLSRSRRKRQKTIDDVNQLKSQEDEFTSDLQVLKDVTTSDKELSKAKKRDQSQLDDHLGSVEDELFAVVDSEKNQHESADGYQKASCCSQPKSHVVLTTEDETTHVDTPEVDFMDKQTSSSQIRRTDVDNTVDETKCIPSTRKKRLQKVPPGSVPPVQSEEESYLVLELIVEEEKKTAFPVLEEICDVDCQIKSKPFNSRADQNGASKQDEVLDDGVTNSAPDAGDEIISATPAPSRKRVRGRIAQPNVIVVESKNKSSGLTNDKDKPDTYKENQMKVSRTFTVKVKPRECEDKDVIAEENNDMTTVRSDAKDEIPSTPLLTKTRGRRPARKLASAEPNVVPALRRTRRGSVQQDIDVEVVKVENKDEEIVLSTPVQLRSRGRIAALKAESTTTTSTNLSPAQKVTHKKAVEEVGEVYSAAAIDEVLSAQEKHEFSQQEVTPALVTDEIQSVKTNFESVSEETEGEIISVPQKARGRKPGTMSKITESVENIFPENHEGKAERHNEKSELGKVIPIKRRKGVAATKLEPTNLLLENSAKQNRRRRLRQELVVEIDSNEINADEKTSSEEAGIHTAESDVENVVPIKRHKDDELSQAEPIDMNLENATKRNRRRPGRFEVVVRTENQYIEANNEENSTQPEVENITEKPDIEKKIISKKPKDGREPRPEVKEEIEKRGLRRAGRQDLAVIPVIKTDNEVTPIPQSTEESELENVIQSKRRKRVVALKSEPVEFSVEQQFEKYDVESKIVTAQSHNHESAAVMKLESANTISTPVRKRGRPAIVKKETLQVESTFDIQTRVPYIETAPLSVPMASRGRGRATKVKLEPTAENETPDHKGKSDMSHGDDEASTDTTPTKNEPVIKPTGRSLRGRKVLEKVNSSAKTSKEILQSAEVVTEETVTKKPSRGRRVLPTSTPNVNVKIEPTETESQKKAVRGRGVVLNKDTILESTSHTEQEQHTTPIKTKVIRGRKLVTKDDTSEKENVKVEENRTTGRGRRGYNKKVDANDAENEEVDNKPSAPEEPETKTTRNRRGVQNKPEPLEDIFQAASEESQHSPPLKKATRGRKHAAPKPSKDSDDEQSLSELQKKSTRSRKAIEPAKEEEKAIPKRTTRRNLEVASEYSQDTPSKRVRRKPNILLGDEFVQ